MIKESFLPAFADLKNILNMVTTMISQVKVNEGILEDSRYDLMFSVEEVNRLAKDGVPFRDAYKKVGLDIEAGNFTPVKEANHTHEGSIGNLCNDKIEEMYCSILEQFDFETYHNAFELLLGKE